MLNLPAIKNNSKDNPYICTSNIKPRKVVNNPRGPSIKGNVFFCNRAPDDKSPDHDEC